MPKHDKHASLNPRDEAGFPDGGSGTNEPQLRKNRDETTNRVSRFSDNLYTNKSQIRKAEKRDGHKSAIQPPSLLGPLKALFVILITNKLPVSVFLVKMQVLWVLFRLISREMQRNKL